MTCLNVGMYVVRSYVSVLSETRKRNEEKRREEKSCDARRRAEQRSIQKRRLGKRIDVKRKAERGREETTFSMHSCNNNDNRTTHIRRNRDTKTRQRERLSGPLS